ncbi:MAG: hypothetical protein E7062_07985 [Spirochaetaceae bacterium]|nr:hypothetical protein [Spirochaetaceae bacterium]
MKKLLVLVGILAAFSLMGCPKDPVNPPASDPIENPSEPDTPDVPDTPDEPETPAEIVLFEGDFSNYSVLTTKTVLSENAGKTLALSIRNDSGAGRDGWGIGNIEFATDETNVYGSKTAAAIELKATTFADNICILEFPVDDVLAAADAEIVTANVYNDCVLVKAVIK